MSKPTVPNTKAKALAQGTKFFFTGKPCKRGHTVERYTESGKCVQCANEWSKLMKAKHKRPFQSQTY